VLFIYFGPPCIVYMLTSVPTPASASVTFFTALLPPWRAFQTSAGNPRWRQALSFTQPSAERCHRRCHFVSLDYSWGDVSTTIAFDLSGYVRVAGRYICIYQDLTAEVHTTSNERVRDVKLRFLVDRLNYVKLGRHQSPAVGRTIGVVLTVPSLSCLLSTVYY